MIENVTIEPRVDKSPLIHVDIKNGTTVTYESVSEFMADVEQAYTFALDIHRQRRDEDK